MNAILGMADLALDTPLTQDQRHYLTVINTAANNLLGVINDLLDFAKIEAGKLQLDHAEFSLRGVLNETLRALAHRAHKKGLELICHVRPEVPDSLMGDAGRLRQVLFNLVGNAIKFTEAGEVVVRVEQVPAQARGLPPESPQGLQPPGLHEHLTALCFSVSDTGIGIPADKQARIFQAFEQADNSTTRRYGGTGLGLSIASRLVELMGGRIGVESEEGRGSVFRVLVPFGLAPGAGAAARRSDLRSLRVLVVDDNATNRRILEEWLRGWEAAPTAVSDGLSALNALWQGVSQGQPFSVVLLDSRMAGIDGLTLAAEMRRSPPLAGCPIILLTSEDQPADRARRSELDIAAVVAKPIAEEELFAALERVLAGPPGQEAGIPGSRPPDLPISSSLGASPLDPATLLTACDESEELLARMIAVFRASTSGHLERLAAAVRDQDADGLREAAHKLRGVVSAFSPPVAEVARQLEQAGADQHLDGADALLGRLSDLMSELTPLLDRLTVEVLRSWLSQRPHQGTILPGPNPDPLA